MKEVKTCKCGIAEVDCEYHKPNLLIGIEKVSCDRCEAIVLASDNECSKCGEHYDPVPAWANYRCKFEIDEETLALAAKECEALRAKLDEQMFQAVGLPCV